MNPTRSADTLIRELRACNARAIELSQHLAGRLLTSQEAERARLARDLHDGVCQEVAAIAVDVNHLRKHGGHIQTLDVQDALRSLERRMASIAESLRLLSHGLHPSVLHQIGFVAALQAHCAEVERRHHMHVLFIADDDVEPKNRSAALSLFRIAQEALRNAATHGRARRARVLLTRDHAELTLAVRDNGAGFDLIAARHSTGLGLMSIEERARLMRGHLTLRSRPGGGATITVRVPIEAVDADDCPRQQEHAHSTSAA